MNIKHHQFPQVGIIADDLTSAADGAGPFVARGLRAMVSRKVQPQYANDPMHPALTSNIANLIASSIDNFLILDAETQAQLDQQIAAIANPEHILWVGSPRMVQSLAKITAPTTRPINLTHLASKILVVVGSTNAISQKQARLLRGVDHVHCLMSPSARQNNPQNILDKLCRQAIDKIQNEGFDKLIATGGDTMEVLLDELGIEQFQLLDELEAGFSIGIAEITNDRSLVIAMKAGGFGTPKTLLAATQKLLGH